MNGRNEENLKGLFEKFFESKQAEKAVEDIRKGEQILRDNPAPLPSDELIASIKSEIAVSLLHKKENAFRKTIYKMAAVAAVVIVLTVISIKFLEKGNEPRKTMYASIMPTSIWESEDIVADDMDLAFLTAEVEQISDEVLSLRMSRDGGNGQNAVTELEIELREIESDFWKG